jgi:hypothetical protein
MYPQLRSDQQSKVVSELEKFVAADMQSVMQSKIA